ncbi:OB-fold domain-containing protein [soil metagenome]
MNVTDTIPKPGPAASPLTRPFWDAAREERLLIQHCRSCTRWVFYPRQRCPHCWADELEWREASGRARIVSFTVVQRAGHPAFADDVPYVVALIDLEEGPRMLTNIVELTLSELDVGDAVEVAWQHHPSHSLPQFRPVRDIDDHAQRGELEQHK